MWLYCVPLLVTTLIRAPMPSRLLFVPRRAMSSQWSVVRAAIHPDLCVRAQRGGHHVDASVAIEIAEGAATMARAGSGGQPRLFGQRDVHLPRLARIAEDRVVLIDIGARNGHAIRRGRG